VRRTVIEQTDQSVLVISGAAVPLDPLARSAWAGLAMGDALRREAVGLRHTDSVQKAIRKCDGKLANEVSRLLAIVRKTGYQTPRQMREAFSLLLQYVNVNAEVIWHGKVAEERLVEFIKPGHEEPKPGERLALSAHINGLVYTSVNGLGKKSTD